MYIRQFWDTFLKIAIKVNIAILYLIIARIKTFCPKYNQSRTSTSGLFCLFRCIFVENITKAGFQYKPRKFCYFRGLYFIDFFCWYSPLFGNKSWTQGVYMKWKLTPRGYSAAPSRLRSGPAGGPSGFNLFYFHTSWNHLCFKIYCQIFVKPTKIEIKINGNMTRKKLRGVHLKLWFQTLKNCLTSIREQKVN